MTKTLSSSWSLVFSLSVHMGIAALFIFQTSPHLAKKAIPKVLHMRLAPREMHAAALLKAPPTPQPVAAPEKIQPKPQAKSEPKVQPAERAKVYPVESDVRAAASPVAPSRSEAERVDRSSVQLASSGSTAEGVDSDTDGDGADALDGGEEVWTEPTLIYSSLEKPQYTEDALLARLEGLFPMNVKIDLDGRVLKAELPKHVGYGMDDRMIAAMLKARFKPGIDPQGNIVAGWVKVKFKLQIPN